MLTGNYLHIVFSSVVVYLFIVFAIRLFGKQELAQLSVFDLVFVMLISNAVQNAMVGADSSLIGGLIAAGALFIVNYILKILTYKFPRISKVIQGDAILLIYKGKLISKNVAKAKLSMDEIMEAIREHGVYSIEEVDLAVLEVDGNISVLSNEFRHKTSRKIKSHNKIISKNTEN